jgi:hypothetical protein
MKNKNIVWKGGRAFDLRAVSVWWLRAGARELRAFLAGYGARKDSGRTLTGSYLAAFAGAERCLERFEAELRRRGLRPRPGAEGDGAGV